MLNQSICCVDGDIIKLSVIRVQGYEFPFNIYVTIPFVIMLLLYLKMKLIMKRMTKVISFTELLTMLYIIMYAFIPV